jgi:6-phosphofructokinase 1
MDPSELELLAGAAAGYDAHGNIRLEKIPLASMIERALVTRFTERGDALPLVSLTLGYELRCAAPIPFDIDYTRTLGYGAVRFLLTDGAPGQSGGVVCQVEGRLRVLPFEDLQEPNTGRIRTRLVDVTSEHYQVAREYMIRLRPSDLTEPDSLTRLANSARMKPQAFVERFQQIFETDALVQGSK